jgi:membrane-bound lytic murein transglycosylase D
LLNIPEDELQYLNPSYRKRVIPVIPDETNFITLPANKVGTFINNETIIYNYVNKDSISDAATEVQEVTKIHIIKKGEHLNTIAQKYGCSVSDIKTWNKIKSNTLKPGKKLTIITYINKPIEKKVIAKPDSDSTFIAKSTDGKDESDDFLYYTVKKGDSFTKIALKNKTTIDEIKRLNNFGSDYHLIPGKTIKVAVF